MDVLYHYAHEHKYLLHEFVVMPDHFHLLITPKLSLERAMQFIKGGFSYRAKHEVSMRTEIWQASYYDRHVRDEVEYERMKHYIHVNPVRRGLVSRAKDYLCSSANPKWILDEVPQGLKPDKLVPV